MLSINRIIKVYKLLWAITEYWKGNLLDEVSKDRECWLGGDARARRRGSSEGCVARTRSGSIGCWSQGQCDCCQLAVPLHYTARAMVFTSFINTYLNLHPTPTHLQCLVVPFILSSSILIQFYRTSLVPSLLTSSSSTINIT